MTTTPHKEQGREDTTLGRLYKLYRDGRAKGAPQSYIDYFSASWFVLNELDTAYERAATEVEGMHREDVWNEMEECDPKPSRACEQGFDIARIEAAERIRSFKSK